MIFLIPIYIKIDEAKLKGSIGKVRNINKQVKAKAGVRKVLNVGNQTIPQIDLKNAKLRYQPVNNKNPKNGVGLGSALPFNSSIGKQHTPKSFNPPDTGI